MTLSEDRVKGLLQHKENFQSVININQEFKSGWLPSEPIKTLQSPGLLTTSKKLEGSTSDFQVQMLKKHNVG